MGEAGSVERVGVVGGRMGLGRAFSAPTLRVGDGWPLRRPPATSSPDRSFQIVVVPLATGGLKQVLQASEPRTNTEF